MPLLAYNKTTSPVALAAGSPIVTLPASLVPGARGKAFDITAELWPNLTVDPAHGRTGGLTAANFTALQVQVAAGSVEYAWTHQPEFSVGTLVVTGPAPGAHATTHKTAGGTDVLAVGSTTAANGATTATNQAAGTGLAGTGAGSSHSHSVASATPGITAAKIRQQQFLGALAAGGTNYVAQYAGGAALDDAIGPFSQFVPPRTVRIVRGGAGVPTVYTIDGLDQDGNPLQDVITTPGAGTVEGVRAFASLTRVRSDVDPTVTTDVKTGNGFGLNVAASEIDQVGLDGAVEGYSSIHPASGTVVPGTAPNDTHLYTVQYRVLPTATQAAHDHGAATGGEAAHTHGITDLTHNHTQDSHNHTQSGHAHDVT
jgi:hypothetical protein